MQLRHITSTIALALALSTPALAADKSSGFKCWVNKDGVRECGNAVPPEYAQERTETVNKRGMTTKVEERAKTSAEVAAEAAAAAAAEQKKSGGAAANEDAKRKILEEEQQRKDQERYDRMINASFMGEADIEAARKRKLLSIDGSIEVTRASIVKLEEKLKKEEQRAATQKPAAATEQQKPAPESAAASEQQKAAAQKKGSKKVEPLDDIESLKKQIADKQEFIAAREKQRAEVNTEYDGYLKRFRELKGIKTP